ncbi:hypothetical protein BBJ28_00011589 [Nothophytophthora sp. Chile5]|nr:hypothetical protein BBJ28_00011589 [Nothophytophthora sp. Chile5]
MADATSPGHESREQLRRLNDSLLSGSLSRREYDELRPFLTTSPPAAASEREDAAFATALTEAELRDEPTPYAPAAQISPHARRSVTFADSAGTPAPTPTVAPTQYAILARTPAQTPAPIAAPTPTPTPSSSAAPPAGLPLRCPACGTCNDTARGTRCEVCDSRLTIGDGFSTPDVGAATSSRRSGAVWGPVVTAMPPPSGAFSAAEDGRVVIHDGFFSCDMQCTQTLATAQGSTCQVFVVCCRWQPRRSNTSQPAAEAGRPSDQQPPPDATWYVSQRFSQFERLHKALKRRLPRAAAAALPPFPAKYHLVDRLEKRKQGLAVYLPRLLEMCAQLAQAQPAPELDEFLDVSRQIQLFRQHRSSFGDGEASRRSASAAATSASSPFPAFTGPAMPSAGPSEATPMDETELVQAEGAVRLLNQAVRRARGDVRSDATVQHHLDMCVKLAAGLQRSADLDNPFADVDLIPRAMQCQEDLQQAVALYNDALLAVSDVVPRQQQQELPAQEQEPLRSPEPHVPSRMPALQVRNVVPASAA